MLHKDIARRNRKIKDYKGKTLTNATVTYKIDGVRAVWNEEAQEWESRARKPLYNLPLPPARNQEGQEFEVYLGDFKSSIQAARTQTGGTPVNWADMYTLMPSVDKRLFVGEFPLLDVEQVGVMMKEALAKGYEGLVIYALQGTFKVKEVLTFDTFVRGMIEGKGKNAGMMGAIETDMGKIGTGFTDAMRKDMWARQDELIGTVIEVQAMEVTEEKKLRHPRFSRERPDKNTGDVL